MFLYATEWVTSGINRYVQIELIDQMPMSTILWLFSEFISMFWSSLHVLYNYGFIFPTLKQTAWYRLHYSTNGCNVSTNTAIDAWEISGVV